jgi:signal transduction histidine kinase
LSNQREEKVFSNNEIENSNFNPQDFLMRLGKISKSKEILFETTYNDLAKRNPIEARIGNVNDFKNILSQNLKDLEIKLDFEYAVYNGDKITGISSINFEKNNQTYSSLIFKDENDLSNYSLKINFPSRTPFLISSLLPVIATSIVFTLIIIIAYITTILLLLRQRQISQIKSDFINNMTHEFKTPIATIDLALSAIKNPKTILDTKKVKKYLKMINDENNRMHDQVENVLMMSQLERKEIYLDKKDHDINELINLAISHVNLIIQSKKGKINFEKNPKLPLVRVNETHMVNIFVNILDNAIKYNENQPDIIIKSRILENKLIIDITDNGIGMSKSTRSKIFDKFYRPQTGDLHNVKGHGLGLSYVKKIIDLHNGSINVTSVLGKGSTFTIQLNLH